MDHLQIITISEETCAAVLERDQNTCQMCGFGAGDTDPFLPSRKVQLTIWRIVPESRGGGDALGNLRAICTNCYEGLKTLDLPKPDRVWLLSLVRRATPDDQEAVLEWLLAKRNLRAIPKQKE